MKNLPKWLTILFTLLIVAGSGFIAYQNLIKPGLFSKLAKVEKLAELHLSGGFTGFCDSSFYYTDGSASTFRDCRNDRQNFRIKPEVLDQLIKLSRQFKQFSEESEECNNCPDYLYSKLVFYGQGKKEAGEEEKITIRRLLQSAFVTP